VQSFTAHMPLLTATSRTPESVNLFCVGRTLMGKGVHSVGRRSRARSRLWSIRLIRVELHGLGSATRQVSTKMMMPLRCSVNTHCHPIVRLHHKHGVQRCSLLCVCLSVCMSVGHYSEAYKNGWTRQFVGGLWTQVGQRNRVLGGAPCNFNSEICILT